ERGARRLRVVRDADALRGRQPRLVRIAQLLLRTETRGGARLERHFVRALERRHAVRGACAESVRRTGEAGAEARRRLTERRAARFAHRVVVAAREALFFGILQRRHTSL